MITYLFHLGAVYGLPGGGETVAEGGGSGGDRETGKKRVIPTWL